MARPQVSLTLREFALIKAHASWTIRALFLVLFSIASTFAHSAPSSFENAKVQMRQKVYYDRDQHGETYCGCPWRWVGRSGGRIDQAACGYEVRRQPTRAARIEWEHITPAWVMGHQRQCWQNGGRKNCISSDPVFRAMEADAHNLTPTVGEVNADRSNYRFTQLSSSPYQYGACKTRVDFQQRAAEPRDEAKGFVARVQFYMHDWYGLNMSRQQQQVFAAWNRLYPVSDWELERDRRIALIMGHSNPYVTGERTWAVGQRSSGDGLTLLGEAPNRAKPKPAVAPATEHQQISGAIVGNRNSKVYHLPKGCPSYNQVSERNRVLFASEAEAETAGYRRAGNCN